MVTPPLRPRSGWQWLEVRTADGIDVAGIYRHLDAHRRTWWLEITVEHDTAAASIAEPLD